MSLLADLETAHAIALEAAALVRGYARKGFSVDHKTGGEPVTEADHAASDLICGRLQAAYPHDVIISEERPDNLARMTSRRVWMVDPIDGTRDFIDGDIGYAVMIGLCVDGRPRVGAVAQPATGVSWAGAVGESAWKQMENGTRTPLRPSSLAIPPGIRLVASKSHRTQDIDLFCQELGITDEINVGGVGIKVTLIAEGTRDLYVYSGGRTKRWDSCAPEAILTAAGGRLTDTNGEPIDYTTPDLLNRRGLVASNGPLHDPVLAAIARIRAGGGPPSPQ